MVSLALKESLVMKEILKNVNSVSMEYNYYSAGESLMKLIAPLRIQVSKKKHFALNLNCYRNSHYMTLNKAKVNFKAAMIEQINQLPELNRITVHYELYPKTKRRTDLGNVISIVKKFCEDCLVELGKLPDDDYTHIISSSESFGEVDKENPRVEITIKKC